MEQRIRLAGVEDAAGVQAVYAPFVEHTAISFEMQPPTAEEMRERIRAISRDYPYLVCVWNGEIVAYAHGSNHQRHTAYCYNADTSIYIKDGYHGKGIGAALYGSLLPLLKLLGIHTAYAGITSDNERSLAFHKAQGFEDVAFYPHDGFKLGAWQDVTWMAKTLIPYGNTPEAVKRMAELEQPQVEQILKQASARLK